MEYVESSFDKVLSMNEEFMIGDEDPIDPDEKYRRCI